jgi:hypothetical protein
MERIMKKILTVACMLITVVTVFAQKTDTVIVELAKTSRMVFTIRDKSDLEQLKQYDFQALFDDILAKLDKSDTVIVVVNEKREAVVTENSEDWAKTDIVITNDDDNDNDDDRKRSYRRTTHVFDIDLGLNSYLEDGKFPDEEGQPYAVRPWGSWNIGLTSVLRTRFTRHFAMQWGLGVSWNNFKFQNDKTVVVKDEDGVTFEEDYRDVSFVKSKLGVTYLNVSAIPTLTFGGHRIDRRWKSYSSGFRIGAGPYVGYRIGSSTKLVYEEDGDRHRDRTRDNFYLNNLRYGVRLQIGIRSADFFFAYDMNELFAAGKGPKLNAFSFGITI